MESSFKMLRIILVFSFVLTVYFAYVMLIDLSTFEEIYAVTQLDPMHLYLSKVGGGVLLVLAIGMGLAFLQPVKYASIVLLTIIYHFVRFVVDVVLLAQGSIAVMVLLPEMVYFVVVCAALIRYFPVKKKEVEESEEADESEETQATEKVSG